MPSSRASIPELRSRSWTWILRNVILPLGDLWFQQRIMKCLRFLEEAQWWDPERLHAERDRRLASLVELVAREVPFYRKLWQDAGVRWDQVRHPQDLERLPIVTKDLIRPHYPDSVTRDTGQKTYETGTSGSTGSNFLVREDAETAGWYRASFLLALEWAGWQIGEPHVQTGITPQRSADRRWKDALLRCHYVSAFDLTDSRLDATLEALEHYRIRHLWGFPPSLFCLARRARQRGWNRPLHSVVTWGDNLYPGYRKAIEGAFGTRVFDTYGCGEGFQISAQCGYGDQYHVHSLDVIVEFLDEEGKPAPSSEPGNVIVTRLHPGPMPLIRYRLGDLAVRGAQQSCVCGRGFDLMESVQGRDTDILVTPSGNCLIVHFFTGVLEHFREVGSYQVIQKETGSMVVKIVPAPGSAPSQEAERRIVLALQQKGAHDMHIHVEWVREIPLTRSGKRRFVISEVSPNLAAAAGGGAWSSDTVFPRTA